MCPHASLSRTTHARLTHDSPTTWARPSSQPRPLDGVLAEAGAVVVDRPRRASRGRAGLAKRLSGGSSPATRPDAPQNAERPEGPPGVTGGQQLQCCLRGVVAVGDRRRTRYLRRAVAGVRTVWCIMPMVTTEALRFPARSRRPTRSESHISNCSSSGCEAVAPAILCG